MHVWSFAMAARRLQASLRHPDTALAITGCPLTYPCVQRTACEGHRMDLQQAMGQQERELRARQSAPPAPQPCPSAACCWWCLQAHLWLKGPKTSVSSMRPWFCQPLLQVQARQGRPPARARC